MKKKLISGLLAAMLASTGALAFEPFVVKDIRVEGIQRTEAGTVFSYLPVKVGETFDEDKAAQAIRALFATGFFKDVRIEVESGILVVVVDERPAISTIEFTGIKEFDKDALKKDAKPIDIPLAQDGKLFIGETAVERSHLIGLLSAMTEGQTDRRIYIRGDQSLEYGGIMELLGAVSGAGFTKVARSAEAKSR